MLWMATLFLNKLKNKLEKHFMTSAMKKHIKYRNNTVGCMGHNIIDETTKEFEVKINNKKAISVYEPGAFTIHDDDLLGRV